MTRTLRNGHTLVFLTCGSLVLTDVSLALDKVVLSLKADRETYYVGEPIRLTLTANNESSTAVRGRFLIHDGERNDIVIVREGEEGRLVGKRKRPGPDEGLNRYVSSAVKRWIIIQPQSSLKSDKLVLLKPGTSEFEVRRGGSYEIYVDIRPWATADAILRTNSVNVTIVSPEGAEAGAFQAYIRDALPSAVESSVGTGRDRGALARALNFISTFPSSPYTDDVQGAARLGLAYLAGRGIATEAELDMLAKLNRDAHRGR